MKVHKTTHIKDNGHTQGTSYETYTTVWIWSGGQKVSGKVISSSGDIPVIFQNAWFYAPLFFVLRYLKKRVMAHSLAIFFKYRRAEKKKQKTCILKDHGYISACWVGMEGLNG